MDDRVEQIRTQYDEVPYTSHAFPQTAPENLAAIAHLFGLDAPAVATARVLELGCSSGGNLIALAARHPQLRALGLDLSGVQIQQGIGRVAALGLENLELRQVDLSQVDSEALGQFDYILCHGVYSWVPEAVQDAILRLCSRNLSPRGVAYLSYNTYPGWKAKEIVRDAMMLRGNPRDTAGERLSFARGMIDFLQQVAPEDSVLAKALEESAPLLRNGQDYYLLHEYLEAFNAPCYFQQLLQRAGAHGLAYLAEAEPSGMFLSNYPREVAEPLLKECGHSQVLLEQYLDFVLNRTFRQTLLVHQPRAQQIQYRLQHSRYAGLHFAADLPANEGASRDDGSPQSYGPNGQGLVTTANAACKRALDALNAAWPATVSHAQLMDQAVGPPEKAAAGELNLVHDLLELLITLGLARFRLDAVEIPAANASSNPCVPEAIRRMAVATRQDADASTFNAWHEAVPLNPVDRWLLPELDGTRDRAALIQSLMDHVAAGRVVFLRDGRALADAAEIAATAPVHVDVLLGRLAAMKLLRAR